jgi:hypothetical protein
MGRFLCFFRRPEASERKTAMSLLSCAGRNAGPIPVELSVPSFPSLFFVLSRFLAVRPADS